MIMPVNLNFLNFSFEKQAELIDELKKILITKYIQEGKEILEDKSKKWDIKPRTPEEAYCREYLVNYVLWEDLKEEDLAKYNWAGDLEFYAEEEAEKKLLKAFGSLKIDLEIEI